MEPFKACELECHCYTRTTQYKCSHMFHIPDAGCKVCASLLSTANLNLQSQFGSEISSTLWFFIETLSFEIGTDEIRTGLVFNLEPGNQIKQDSSQEQNLHGKYIRYTCGVITNQICI